MENGSQLKRKKGRERERRQNNLRKEKQAIY